MCAILDVVITELQGIFMNGIETFKRMAVLLALCAASSQAFAGFSDSGTLTTSSHIFCRGSGAFVGDAAGYSNGVLGPLGTTGAFGNYSPTGVAGGETVAAIAEVIRAGGQCGGPSNQDELVITGFSANPGALWLTSLTCDGVLLTTGSGAGFVYSSGVASWVFTNTFNFFGFSNGAQYSCTIVHN